MNELRFLVQGSAAEPYEVTFVKDGESLTAICTCPAGQHGNFCKHRISILEGDTRGIASDNVAAASQVATWLPGTDVESALAELRRAEKLATADKETLTAARKKLARAMNS